MPHEKEFRAMRQILVYCEKAENVYERFFPTREQFDEEEFYRDGCAFYIQQIGEFVNDLSDEFIGANEEIPWHQIRGFRNVIAHAYGSVDPDILWETITEDLLRLACFCRRYLTNH